MAPQSGGGSGTHLAHEIGFMGLAAELVAVAALDHGFVAAETPTGKGDAEDLAGLQGGIHPGLDESLRRDLREAHCADRLFSLGAVPLDYEVSDAGFWRRYAGLHRGRQHKDNADLMCFSDAATYGLIWRCKAERAESGHSILADVALLHA